jgi:hypothetical protein
VAQPVEKAVAREVLTGTGSKKFDLQMRGLITTRHLVTHAPLIVRLFGVRVYLKCVACVLRKGGRATFLDAVSH